MIARNVTVGQMEQALAKVNERYKGNVEWNRFEPKRTAIHFTLSVKSSKGPGHRLGFCRNKDYNRRRLAKACWHVHGHFFEALLEVEPQAIVRSAFVGVIDKDGGNWQDKQIGSMVDPLWFSEACECA